MLPLLLASTIITNSTTAEARSSGGADAYASVYVENMVNNGSSTTTVHVEHSGNGTANASTITVPIQGNEALDYATSTGSARVDVHIKTRAGAALVKTSQVASTSSTASSTPGSPAHAPKKKSPHWEAAIAAWFGRLWSIFRW